MAKKDKAENLPATAQGPQLPAQQVLDDIYEHAGAGALEGATTEDFQIPMLYLLQKLSPQLDENDGAYVEEATTGDFYNTALRALLPGKDGFLAIPILRKMVYIEWVPRDSGGGFVNVYDTKQEALQYAEEGNDIVDTAQWYLYAQMPDGTWAPVMMPMTSSKLTTSRNWMTQIKFTKIEKPDGSRVTPPSFATVYRVSSSSRKNEKGTWSNVDVEYVGFLPELVEQLPNALQLYAEARALYEDIRMGRRGVDYEAEEGSTTKAGVDDTDEV